MRTISKKRILYLVAFLMFHASLGTLGYHMASDWFFRYTLRQEITEYETAVADKDEDAIANLKKTAMDYNAMLCGKTTNVSAADYNDILAMTDAIGYLDIPKLNVYLPIYHGLEDEVLQRGIGHLPESSLPVGGLSTHCVLSGHSGLVAAKLLTGLDRMETGDVFYIHVLDEVLVYQVDQIKVVLPEDTSQIGIAKGKDYVTLLTCTPYGINTHRLLVRGERTQPVPGMSMKISGSTKSENTFSIPPNVLAACAAIGTGIYLFTGSCLILFLPVHKRNRKSLKQFSGEDAELEEMRKKE